MSIHIKSYKGNSTDQRWEQKEKIKAKNWQRSSSRMDKVSLDNVYKQHQFRPFYLITKIVSISRVFASRVSALQDVAWCFHDVSNGWNGDKIMENDACLIWFCMRTTTAIVYISIHIKLSTVLNTRRKKSFFCETQILRRRQGNSARLAVIIARGWNFHFYLLIIQHVFCLPILCARDWANERVYAAVLWSYSYNGEHIMTMMKLLNYSLLPFHCGWMTRFWWFLGPLSRFVLSHVSSNWLPRKCGSFSKLLLN